eukprot:384959_1
MALWMDYIDIMVSSMTGCVRYRYTIKHIYALPTPPSKQPNEPTAHETEPTSTKRTKPPNASATTATTTADPTALKPRNATTKRGARNHQLRVRLKVVKAQYLRKYLHQKAL